MKIALLVLVFFAGANAAAPIVSYKIETRTGAAHDVPVTFGAVFAPGDVPARQSIAAVDASGKVLPFQVDAKARNRDGSLRHAVLTVNLPQQLREAIVAIVPGSLQQGAPVMTAALPNNFDVTVELKLGDGKRIASARDLIRHAKPETWLSGPLVSEWWVAGPLRDASGKSDPHLSVRFGIRCYGANRPLRIEVDVENDWTWVPGPKSYTYAADITANGKSVYHSDKLVQHAQTRWRQVFWWDAPIDAFVKHDLGYLKKTRAVPNFNQARDVDLGDLNHVFLSKNRGPMGSGIIYPAMPVTGQRPDIGPLPGWTVAYLLDMDPKLADMTFNAGDLSGSFPAHYRNEKTGNPVSTEEFPKISTHYNYVGREGHLPLPENAGAAIPFTAEPSHEPSLAFVPYLVTGERYYLEELQFWSQWNAWGTAPEYHGYAKGLIGWDQIRGQGWSLRTLAQAAFITPDADPMKAALAREMKANADWYNHAYTNNPQANVFHAALQASDDANSVAPWMDDFLTWAAQYAVQLGFDEFRPFARWKGVFPVQRMVNPDYCYVMATKYYMKVMDAPHHFIESWAKAYRENLPKEIRDAGAHPDCGSDGMARAFRLGRAGEMMGDSGSPDGYPAQMQPALAAAIDAGVPGAAEAWTKFKSRPVHPRGGVDPRWDILPWSAGN